MTESHGYAALTAKAELVPFTFQRRPAGPHDVTMKITYCGICHSDLFYVDNDWGMSMYPMVPGHEIVGTVTAVGDKVTRFKVGDTAAIGCIIDSCRHCDPCTHDKENMCLEFPTPTYGGYERQGGGQTFGGYSNDYVADENYMVKVPDSLDPAAAAPLLCAGITTYSPLRHWGAGPGKKVGIVGIGGLGHVAIKLARAMGAHVVVFTTSPGKIEDAKALGAHEVVVSSDPAQMAAQVYQLDFILNTVSAKHDLKPFLAALKIDATLCMVGAPAESLEFWAFDLIMGRKSIAGSPIGGMRETQEMLDFCGEHGIVADIEMVSMKDINAVYKRLHKSDVKYRFVIDMATLD